MARLNSLKDLFIHHIRDLYNAESQLESAAPDLVSATGDDQLKNILQKHGSYIKEHKENLEWIANKMGFDPKGETCHAMTGLIKETKHFLGEDAGSDVRDAGIIADAQRIAHYFITGYGTVSNWSDQMEMESEVKNRCKAGIDNAEKIDSMLKELAQSMVNEEAMH